MERIYMDHAAATRLCEGALEAMFSYFRGEYGNPSAICSYGQTAKKVIDMKIPILRCWRQVSME